jgi:glutamate/tyrosine decarboxylase-like PLP-dependent enzyme
MRPDAPALDPAEFRRLGHELVDLLADHLAGLSKGPVFVPMDPGERQALLEAPLPGDGVSPAVILDRLRRQVLPHPMGNGHPRFFGWVNSPPAPLGVLAELAAAAINPSCAGGDHAAIYLERAAVRWLMELVGYPIDRSMGLLVSGGSVASLTGLAAARHHAAAADGWNVRAEGLQNVRPPLVLYISEDGHSALRKAAELLGLGAGATRVVRVDDRLRMDVEALRAAVSADRSAGRRPFCVAASAGTASTGAIDPLDAIADLCAEEGLWLHIDGAYGAVAAVHPDRARRLAGLARADSLALDPHKWLAVPVECGCVLVRDGAVLRDAFSLVPPYLRTEEGRGFGGLPWFSEYGIQQTRGFRALKLWMTLQHMGRAGVERLIARHVELAAGLARIIEASPDLELLAPVELSIVCFRHAPPHLRGDDRRLDELNRTIVERVQAGGEAFLSQTTVRGRFALRACILHPETTEADLQALLAAIRVAATS